MTGRLLAITGGHRIDEAAFTSMVDAVCDDLGWTWRHERQPTAQDLLHPERVGEYDAVFLHDLPGLTLERGAEPIPSGPDPDVRAAVLAMLEQGQGIVATHHALAGWPVWDEWADLLGGRFFYAPGRLHGERWPASGYRMDTYGIDVVAPDHPVCRGVESFTVTDELYLCAVQEADVVPLLRTSADLAPETMIDTYVEVRHGRQVPVARHAAASSLLGWAKRAGRSPLVYLVPGHETSTMEAAAYRRLLANAFEWVASPEAEEWAAGPK